MELTFQPTPISWLRCVLRETRRQEETSEAIVPDVYPDIGAVTDAHAATVIRGKDLRAGSVTISGGIKGGVIYMPEDGSWPRSLEFYMPFTVKLEHPELTEQSQVLCDARISAVDGKMINSRKALLRVELCCSVTAYEPVSQTLYTLLEQPVTLRVKRAQYDMELPLETAEKSFVISDSLELPAGSPPMEQACRLMCQLELTDKKLVGARAVFRGNARCRLLYLSENHDLCAQTFQLPFSQFCDLQTDYDGDEQVTVFPVITGYDLEPESQSASQKGYLNLHVLAQCLVHGKQRMQLLEDAFSTSGPLTPQWESFSPEAVLDRPQTVQTIRLNLNGEIHQVLDATVYADVPSVSRQDDRAVITAPVSAHVLGYDREGTLCAASGKGSGSWEIPMEDAVRCTAQCEMMNEPFVSAAADGTEIRMEVSLQGICTRKQSLQTLSGGVLEEAAGRGEMEPSVILRRAARGAALWDLAKAAGANEEALRRANGLEGDVVPEDRVLLIPVG